MDEVFKALADPTRRAILDELRRRPGLSLAELCALRPAMTRFGVSAHLAVLESAGLVATVRDGRRKLHYLDAVPLQQVHDRWLTAFASSTASSLLTLRDHLETTMKPQHVMTIDIAAPVATVWAALTSTGVPRPWLYGTITTISSSAWLVGERYAQHTPDGTLMIDGDIIEIVEERRLVLGFHCHWDERVEAEVDGRLTYELHGTAAGTRLTVALAGLGPATLESAQASTREIYQGFKDELENQ